MTMKQLPEAVIKVLEGSFVSEFATVSGAGVPIDTPTLCFATDDLSAVGVATGLSYPAKAERARRNPKVGLLIEGQPGEPVVSIRGIAAVRDSDLQANAIRYLSETGWEMVGAQAGVGWDKAREAVWYFSRIIIDIAPERVLWWDNADAMDQPPHVWNGLISPDFRSDPAPAGKGSPAPKWPQRTWQEIAADAIARSSPGHLTLLDADGWPLPIRATSVERVDEGFRLVVPKGAPWAARSGTATLTFQGVETFVGEAVDEGETILLNVERALPQNPLTVDPAQVLNPAEDTRAKLFSRLEEETQRRGQPIPVLPQQPPARTRLAQARFDRQMAFELAKGE